MNQSKTPNLLTSAAGPSKRRTFSEGTLYHDYRLDNCSAACCHFIYLCRTGSGGDEIVCVEEAHSAYQLTGIELRESKHVQSICNIHVRRDIDDSSSILATTNWSKTGFLCGGTAAAEEYNFSYHRNMVRTSSMVVNTWPAGWTLAWRVGAIPNDPPQKHDDDVRVKRMYIQQLMSHPPSHLEGTRFFFIQDVEL
jgi:hypothetical protein